MKEIRNLLIEIGTEELPPKALLNLSNAFVAAISDGLQQKSLNYNTAIPFATPRRLAVMIEGLTIKQADQQIEKKGPAVAAAFDKEGQPTKAALGFARSCKIEVSNLAQKDNRLVYNSIQVGQSTVSLIPNIIETALAVLPIPKRMRWSNLPFEFVRPVHWVVVLFGSELIETEIMGIKSGCKTRGHRFHHPEPINLTEATDYETILEKTGHVIVDFNSRREHIKMLAKQAATHIGGTAVIDEDLLNEVTGLVEWPTAITGSFDEQFLEIPSEALIASMQGHQKYFPVVNQAGDLLPNFIAISNINSKNPEVVQAGNERVIRPRLSDAAFFWKQDRTTPLINRLEQLKTVIFQNKLGSLYDKSKRVAQLCGNITKQLGVAELQGIRAGQLSKCDLVTDMVGEFPELQGIMGQYYAQWDKETDKVAIALREQYMPRFAGDELPTTSLGQALAIADKLDTLIGIFGIGQVSTGDKDPFGLRRAALSILRIMIECRLPLDLQQLLIEAQIAYPDKVLAKDSKVFTKVFDFMLERLRNYYQEQDIPLDSIEAILVCRPTSPLDFDNRIQAIKTFRDLPEMASLASANKRIHNILKKADQSFPNEPNPTYFKNKAERNLYDAMESVNEAISPLLKVGDYQKTLQHLASLREVIDTFFDDVMVMDENPIVRDNRLAFLQKVRNLFLQVADISKLQV